MGKGARGGNRGRSCAQNSESAAKNRRDQAVHRDPDIGGIMRRESHGPHMRRWVWEFIFNPFKRDGKQ